MREGRLLGDLGPATREMTLVEAPSPRLEAAAIALRLRRAAVDGQRAALVTPDRNLTRRVAAILDRWGIEPDDSGGRPLALSAPGRLLRHVADLFAQKLTPAALLTVLKHPLVRCGSARGPHLLATRELEMHLRRKGPAFPDAAAITAWGAARSERAHWAQHAAAIADPPTQGTAPLETLVARHMTCVGALCRGPDGATALWDEEAGLKARAVMDELVREAPHGGRMSARDYAALVGTLLDGEQVRSAVRPHQGVMIWGTLEARVGGADLVILAGLNEGVWPAAPQPDPWLNREMRHQVGLLLPERQIGLAAHDFQQAAGAPEVMLTRARRDADAETVASRWLSRLTNLLDGLPDQDGPSALAAMRARGETWLHHAHHLDDAPPVPPAIRPAPRPPVSARPRQLSVTEIARLIRDPYAIYARRVLRLKPLDPLVREPDAPLRGTVLHAIFDRFVREGREGHPLDAPRLSEVAAETLAAEVPWPAARQLWQARIDRLANWFVATERQRQAKAHPVLLEESGRMEFPDLGFTLTGKADRIDALAGGGYAIYDYKTGTPPSEKAVRAFEKQLLLEAMMVEAGAFAGLALQPVRAIAYIGLGARPIVRPIPLGEGDPPIDIAAVPEEFRKLVAAFQNPARGFTSRRAMREMRFEGDYDHLARFGEWDDSTTATPEAVG